MKLIESGAKYIPQESSLEGIYKQIELAGRNCYKSEDKITEDSAKGFVDRMIKSKHYAMLEHGTVYLKVFLNNALVLEDASEENNDVSAYNRYINNKYSKVNFRDGLENIFITDTVEPGYAYITTNLRVLVENGWLDDLKYLCEPTEYHEKRYTFKFTTDQGVLREITRHRVFSFAVESTRYCNYSKNKFNNEVTYIIPSWINSDLPNFTTIKDDWGELFPEYYYKFTDLGEQELNYSSNKKLRDFVYALSACEKLYFALLEEGWKPQQARNILPLATKCDVIMTGFTSDWKHFFDLRMFGTTGEPHPDMKLLAKKASIEAIHAHILEDIVNLT